MLETALGASGYLRHREVEAEADRYGGECSNGLSVRSVDSWVGAQPPSSMEAVELPIE
jgi:hypothetical protein